MSRIVVEYNPTLQKVTEKIIRNEVSPSMISNDETSCQYDISMVEQCLEEVHKQDLEDVDISNDLKYIKDLINENVHYIEF